MRARIAAIAVSLLALSAVLTLSVLPAQAADGAPSGGLWRCGPGNYSDRPCAGGAALATEAGPGEEERRAADAQTQKNRRAADILERDRLRLEAQARREGRPIVLGDAPPQPAAAPAKKERARKPAMARREVFKVRNQPPKQAQQAR